MMRTYYAVAAAVSATAIVRVKAARVMAKPPGDGPLYTSRPGAYKARMDAKWPLLIVFAGAAVTVQGQGAAGQKTLDFLTRHAG